MVSHIKEPKALWLREVSEDAFKPQEIRAGVKFGTYQLPDFVAESVSLNVEAGRTTRDIEIEAVKPGFIEVTVRGKEDAKPMAGVGVSATSKGFSAGKATDDQGIALLALVPGTYNVSAYKDTVRRVLGEAVEVEVGGTNQMALEFEAPNRITGVVLDPAGKPVPGLPLSVIPEYRVNVGMIKTDAEGRFSFPWRRSNDVHFP